MNDLLRNLDPLRSRRSHWGGSAFRLVLGLAVMGLGLIFFLDNLYVIDAKPFLRYFPAFAVIALGAASFAEVRRMTFTVSLWFLAGAWLLLDALRITDLDFWDAFIPLALVILGARLLMRSWPGSKGAGSPGSSNSGLPATGEGGGEGESHISAVAVMAGVSRASRSSHLRRVDTAAFMGGVELDLRHASPAEGVIVVDALAIWGGIEIWVPGRLDGGARGLCADGRGGGSDRARRAS